MYPDPSLQLNTSLKKSKKYESESRQGGLVPLLIHRDNEINRVITLNKFANSGKNRNLDLI